MPISWNEVRNNAIGFAREWSGATREEAEAKSFWDAFFQVFGLKRRTVASFEEPVRNIRGQYSFIDLFWRGVLVVEHKSRGKSLAKAETQAFEYIQDLIREGRHDEVPRYIIVSDFARIVLHDLEPETEEGLPLFNQKRIRTIECPLAELHKNVREFAFIKGEKSVRLNPEDPANEKAYLTMAGLHDALHHGGFTGHELEVFLVRILFCLFAEDTGIFDEPSMFQNYLERHTREDGSDLGAQLNRLFEVLNSAEDKRQRTLDEDLAAFPYVNGALFNERLGFADFNRDMRNALLACCRFHWARISPAVFGSLFQGIMDPAARRQSGGHYTSERDIMKVIRSLFLDALQAELAAIKADRSSRKTARLEEFHQKLRQLRFLDPACGCGNFLVLTYRELRRLELAVLRELHGNAIEQQQVLNVRDLCLVDVDQCYGIEISEWPVRIAEVALWLMDHQMNVEVAEAFGQTVRRLPLKASPHIRQANALRLDWKTLLPPKQCSYVLGNPPFVGKHYQTRQQKIDLNGVLSNFRNVGDVDYVVAWFKLAAEYIYDTNIKVGFVSTNSITQGEQVSLVWGELLNRYSLTIHFAHRTFAWMSESKGKAHVHVVIIGFGVLGGGPKFLYDYDADPEHPVRTEVSYISPYLTPGPDALVTKRQTPLGDVPEMRCGNKPSDGGHLILTDEEKDQFLAEEPGAKKYLRRYTGSEEFINGNMRWCLWLVDADPSELRALPRVLERVQKVKEFRKASTAAPTRASAQQASVFFYISQPDSHYIAIPEVSSERRTYIPIGFLPPEIIASNKIYIIPSPSHFIFGMLSSRMHMAWTKQVCGRLESRFQYSGSIVYNNYPWPQKSTEKQKATVEAAAQKVLDVRIKYLPPKGNCTLADLYDPLAMPPDLVKAHAGLDKAVDVCYRPQPFENDRQRVEYLFALYEQLTAPLAAAMAAKPRRSRR
ncbi:MAG: DNA methyltransferase [Verrucomicrobiota bacterium]